MHETEHRSFDQSDEPRQQFPRAFGEIVVEWFGASLVREIATSVR